MRSWASSVPGGDEALEGRFETDGEEDVSDIDEDGGWARGHEIGGRAALRRKLAAERAAWGRAWRLSWRF